MFLLALSRSSRCIRLLSSSSSNEPSDLLLILGGNHMRELAAASLAGSLRSVKIVLVSSGAASHSEIEEAVVTASGRADVRILIDRSAIDTLSNFTTIAAALEPMVADTKVQSIYVSTSHQHALRSSLVGALVLGAVGVRCIMVPVSSPSEPTDGFLRCVRDVLRAVCWLLTGFDGTLITRRMHPRRAADSCEFQHATRLSLAERLAQAML